MEAFLATILPQELIETIAASAFGPVALPVFLALVTASLVAFSIPGAINSMSFLSGVVLGFGGMVVVFIGALVGTHLLFIATRRWLGHRIERRFGDRIATMHQHLERRGPFYVVTARVFGTPHLLVTGACAAAPISARTFLTASMLGMLPAIALATLAGAAIFSF